MTVVPHDGRRVEFSTCLPRVRETIEVSHDEQGELRVTDDEESFERFATACFGT